MGNKIISQEAKVADAFSRQANIFDENDSKNPIVQWMRNEVRKQILEILKPQCKILELNAGTGLDAVFFAEKGFHVHATDNAPGMMDVLKEKIISKNLQDKITAQQCSLNNLSIIEEKNFNHIFSNFGGLNCVENIENIFRNFDKLLAANGTVTLVVMPPVCLWEISMALKGNFKLAFRRFKKNGTPSHLNGIYFSTYYYSPNRILKAIGKNYKLISIKGLCILVPPPYLIGFAIEHPEIFKALAATEKYICHIPPFRICGDYAIIHLQKTGSSY